MSVHTPRLRGIALLLLLLCLSATLFAPRAASGQRGAAEPPPPHYLILAPVEYTAALQPLLALKQAQGFTTSLLTLEACGSTPAEIKACLRSAYQSPTPPAYVLLVGSAERLPPWPSQINPNRQTDLYYATMDGSQDITPNFHLGRLPVRSADELSRIIAAWQAYAGLAGNETWLRRAAFLATDAPDARTAAEATLNDVIGTYTAPRGYQGDFPSAGQLGGDHLYAYTYAADREAVRTALNNGRSLVVYLGEMAFTALPGGSMLSAWKAPAFDQNDVRALTANPVPLVLSLAGRSADFTLGEAFGETWVRQPEHGALTFIGATQETQTALDHYTARTFHAALFASPTPTLGQALHTALASLAADYPDSARRYWEAYTLLGDPSLRLRLFSLAGDFSLSVQPNALGLCRGSLTTAQVALGALNGFSAPVSLELADLPAGAQYAFVPPWRTPPGESLLTLSTSPATPAGPYLLTLQGRAEGLSHSLPLSLQVAAAPPDPTQIIQPAPGASGVPLQPTFTWPASPTAQTYTLEVAHDSAFSAPVLSVTDLSTTTYTPSTPLPAHTLLFARVRTHNPCGESLSPVIYFTSRPLPGTCPPDTTPVDHFATSVASSEPQWGLQGWSISTQPAHSTPYAFSAAAPANPATAGLNAPVIALPPASLDTLPLTLSFWLYTDLEGNGATCFDGLVLEISTDNGATWQSLPPTAYLEGGPTGIVATSSANPLGGQTAWCGQRVWTQVRADLTDYAGQDLRLRWRLGSDDRNASPGAWLDDIRVSACQASPRYALALLPALSTNTGSPAETLAHTLTLTNTGSAVATFDLSLTPGAWPTTLRTATPLTLAAGESTAIRVEVSLPEEGSAVEDTATLTATAREDAGITAQATLHSRRHYTAFTLETSTTALTTLPGVNLPIPLTLRNTGTLPLRLDLTPTLTPAWAHSPLSTQSLEPGEARTLALFVSVPANAPADQVASLHLEAHAEEAPAQIHTLDLTLIVLPLAHPQVRLPALPPYLPRGSPATLWLEVTNLGNLRDRLDLTFQVAAPLTLAVPNDCASLDLAAGASQNCLLTLNVPPSAPKGSATFKACATSGHDPQAVACLTAALNITDRLLFLPLVGR